MTSNESVAPTPDDKDSLSPSAVEANSPINGAISVKIQAAHRQRLAVVYVRQSSPHQVLHHRESRERQYALADHAVALGWPRDRVLVVDDDTGTTAKTAEHRGGFHRILAEVTME